MYLSWSIHIDHLCSIIAWSIHIDHLCSIIASKISLLRQLTEYVSVENQKLFYQECILPYIDYASAVWVSAACVHTERLLKLQKRATRIILHCECNTPSEHMFKELAWFSVSNLIKYNKAVLTYRALNNFTPQYMYMYISNLLKPVSEVHATYGQQTMADYSIRTEITYVNIRWLFFLFSA